MNSERKDVALALDPETPGIPGSRSMTAATQGATASSGIGESTNLWGAVRIIMAHTVPRASSTIHHDILPYVRNPAATDIAVLPITLVR